jgi:two-component system chemotaxis sensor kinase CheA
MPRRELLDKYSRRGVTKALVLKSGELRYALLIDDALETEETLVKPLPIYFTGCGCYKSVTVLGSGKTVMILDAKGLLKLTGINGAAAQTHIEPVKNERQFIYFKGSGSEYFAIDAAHAARVERISQSHLQTVAGGVYVNIGGKTVRVLRPEDYAPVAKNDYGGQPLYLVLLKETALADAMPLALLAGGAPNRSGTASGIDAGRFKSEFVLGSVAFHEKILLFLDTDEIVRSIEGRRSLSDA